MYLTKMEKLVKISALFFATLITLVTQRGVLAQRVTVDRIRIGYATSSGQASPLWVTQDAGFFKKNRLEVELIYMQGGLRVVQGIVSGTLNVGWGGGSDTINARLAGADIKIIAAFNDYIPYKLIAAKHITKPEQLKGQRIAVSSIGSSSHFWGRYALKRLGLAEKDVAAVAVGSDLARLAALESGAAQTTVVELVTALIAQKKGYPILLDLTTDRTRFLGAALVVQSSFIERQAEICRRVIKALVDGIHFLKTHRQESLQIIGRRMRIADEEIVEANYIQQGLQRTLSKPVLSEEGIQTILTMLGERIPNARTAQPQQFVDPRFIRELEETGYVESLYRKSPEAR